MAAAELTLLVVVLEALGILQDVGLALGVAGVLLTIVFGLTASTRSSLTGFRGGIVPRLDRIRAGRSCRWRGGENQAGSACQATLATAPRRPPESSRSASISS